MTKLAPVSRVRAWASFGAVGLAIALDVLLFKLYWRGLLDSTVVSALRITNGVGAMAAVAILLRLSRVNMGLRLESDIPWRLVFKWGWRAAAAFVGIFLMSVWVTAWTRGTCSLYPLVRPVHPEVIASAALLAPLVEEPLYRGALCPAAHSVLGRRGGIVACGVVFGGLHVVYGNPGIDNLTAGFLFGWLFYWSRSLLIPSLVHGVGNGLLFGLLYLVRRFYDLDAMCGG